MNRNTLITIVVLAVILIGAGFWAFSGNGGESPNTYGTNNRQKNMNIPTVTQIPQDAKLPAEYAGKVARVQTNFGTFTVSFFDNDAPLAVENFIRLGRDGYYNNAPFHRVISGFMIQSGDYTRGDGTGGSSIWGQPFPDELNPETESYKMGYKRGTVAMANAGSDTNGSQFFVMHADSGLPHLYTIFGQVTEGLETIDKIAAVPVVENNMGEHSVPTEKIIIEKVTIENK